MSKKLIVFPFVLLFCLTLNLAAISVDTVKTQKQQVANTIKKCNYRYHPAISRVYINYKRTEAMYELEKRKVKIPSAFIQWINKTPNVATAVYGTRENVADVIETLWALRLGLGAERFQKYTNLMLAGALFNSELKDKANNLRAMVRLKPSSELLKDPRKPVNTRSKKRKLDANDHIINFLNSNKIKSDHNASDDKLFTELKYDTRGIAISNKSKSSSKGAKLRNLYASDVFADPALQTKFNEYMKSKGFPNIKINCGNRLVHWKSTNMVGSERGGIREAYELFKTAYEEKGLLPKTRPLPTLSERFAFLIRNDQVKNVSKGPWPRFPLNSPWPVLRLLTYNYKMQTLRECEERWVAFRNKGEMRCYGEYIGKVAQQYDMQSARRLAPYPFTYGSIQIIMKDGGVCGLMARMGTLTQLTLGIPAVQAGQPGHCALIVYHYDRKQRAYKCSIQQSVTAGPEGTWPHSNYNFADSDRRLSMIYDQATAYAVNYSPVEFNNSLVAYNAFATLTDAEQKSFGGKYMSSIMKINPYNLLTIDKAVAAFEQPQHLVHLGKEFKKLFPPIKKGGCPKEGLYQKTVREKIIAKIGKLEIPKQKKTVHYVYDFLKSAPCDDAVLMNYRLKVEKPQAVFKQIEIAFRDYLKVIWTLPLKDSDGKTESLNSSLQSFANTIKATEKRKAWALKMLKFMRGKEMYFNVKNDLIVNPIFTFLAETAKINKPSDDKLLNSVQVRLFKDIKHACEKSKDFSRDDFNLFSQNMRGVVQTHAANEQTKKWLKTLKSTLENHKKVTISTSKIVDNPCYATITEIAK